MKIDCAQLMFEQMQKDGFNVSFRKQINNCGMLQIINELLEKNDG